MENLLPREAYDVDETGYWRRMPIIVGTFFGVCMGIFMFFNMSATAGLLYHSMPASLICGAMAGLFFGLAFPRAMRTKIRKIQSGLYNEESWIANSPPPMHIRYRLGCSQLIGTRTIGGILYLGGEGIVFVPHKKNLKDPATLEMRPLEAITIRVVEPPRLNILQKILIPSPQKLLEIKWTGRRETFLRRGWTT